MAFSFTDDVGDGIKVAFTFGFTGPDKGYIRDDDIEVEVDGVSASFTLTGDNSLTMDVAPADQALVRIFRVMPKSSPYSDFTRGNPFGQRNINNSFLQQLYLMHSISDGFREDDYYEKQDLNIGGNQIINLRPPVNAEDVTDKAYVDARSIDPLDVLAVEADRIAAEAAKVAAELAETGSETARDEAVAAAGAGTYLNVLPLSGDIILTDTDTRTLYLVDTSGGDVTITLPAILADGIQFGFQKFGASNSVIITSTDNINGAGADYIMTADTEVAEGISDDNTPDNWIFMVRSQTLVGGGLAKVGSTISFDAPAAAGTGLIGTGTSLEVDYTTVNTWTLPQREGSIVDNDGSFDQASRQNFTCTPAAPLELNFTNPNVDQGGRIMLINTGGHAITKNDLDIICDEDCLATISVAGTYLLGYWCYDGVKSVISYTGALI